MKTMKAHLNQLTLATFLSVVLIAGSVHAEGINVASCLENSAEPKLEMEKWMVNESYWYPVELMVTLAYEQEKNLSVEDWMVDASTWQLPVFEYLTNEKDQKLMVESWMISSIYWNEKRR